MNTEQGSLNDNLTRWFQTRPAWLQKAAEHRIQGGFCDDSLYMQLADLCKQEARKTAAVSPPSLSFLSLLPRAPTANLRLDSIKNIQGVNALSAAAELKFGEANICIVYGANGSGKSGYIRLLKNMCGARKQTELLGNVYEFSSPAQATACIIYEKDGENKTYIWKKDQVCADLQDIDIFDNISGELFVKIDGEAQYEPPLLTLLGELTSDCEKVKAILEGEIKRTSSQKPKMPAELQETRAFLWYDSLKYNTVDMELCVFSESEGKNLAELQQRLAEQAPADKAKQLRRQLQAIALLKKIFESDTEQVSEQKLQELTKAHKELQLQQKCAAVAARNISDISKLEGIGTDVWKELWKAARIYSETKAYKNKNYPYIIENSRCVLCQQPLTQESKERFQTFDGFIKGSAQKSLDKATEFLNSILSPLKKRQENDTLQDKIAAARLPEKYNVQAEEAAAALRKRQEAFLAFKNNAGAVSQLPDIIPLQKKLSQFSQEIERQALTYEADTKNGNRKELQQQVKELKAKHWLMEQRKIIEAEIQRLKKYICLKRRKKNQ